MPIARRTRLTYGRGKLYFEPETVFGAPGTGEIYIGNTPSMVISYDRVTQTRYQSYGDQRDVVDGPVIEEKHAGKFATDDLTDDNLALWFGQKDVAVESRAPVNANVIRTVNRGRYYSVGADTLGERSLLSFTMRRADTNAIIPAAGNYEIDLKNARLFVYANSQDIGGMSQVRFIYQAGAFMARSFNPGNRETIGALRYISDNPLLTNTAQMQVYWPRVKVTNNAEWELKSESNFLEAGFKFEAMRGADAQYCHVRLSETESRPWSSDEYAIVTEGGITLEQFPPLEDELNTIINVIMPSRGYPLGDITK